MTAVMARGRKMIDRIVRLEARKENESWLDETVATTVFVFCSICNCSLFSIRGEVLGRVSK